LVILDVVVTDPHGQPVRGLTCRDFRVIENGVEQKLASFEAPSLRKSQPSLERETISESSDNSMPARNILVLDELNTAVLDEASARQSMEKYLRKHGPVLNQPTSLLIVGQDHLEFPRDYTRDGSALRDALHGHHAALPFSQMTGGAYGAVDRLAKTLWVLEQIASANLHYAGRKNVIWIGSGFPELSLNSIAAQDRGGFAEAIKVMARKLADARLVVYTINPQGLEVAPAAYEDSFGDPTSGELLFEGLAPQTGGKIFRLQNQIDEAIAKSMEDGAAYYTLTYSPSDHNWDGQFRNVRVVVEGRNLEARARNGYYAVAESPLSAGEVDDAVAQALMSPMPYRGLDVRATVTRVDEGAGKYLLRVDGDALDWQSLPSGKQRCQVTVVTATMSAGAQFAAHNVRELEAVADAQHVRKPSDKPVVFSFVAELPRDTHYVKVVLRDSTNGNIGTTDISKDAIKLR
jgi:VWFA-related protein